MDRGGGLISALESLAAERARLISRGGAYASLERSAAWNHFAVSGFPQPGDEAWKYTPPSALFGRGPFAAPPASEAAPRLPPELEGSSRLVFVNGRMDPRRTRVPALARVIAAVPPLPRQPRPDHGLEALNRALFEEAALIEVAEGEDGGLLEIVHLMREGADETLVHPRVAVRLGRGARLALVETFAGDGEAAYLVNAITEASLEEGAELEHCAIQLEGRNARHASSLAVHQRASSRLSAHAFHFGAGIARRAVRVTLGGEGAHARLEGLSASFARHHDLHVEVEHREPSCTSRQRFRAVLSGRARAAFTGRVGILPAAQRSDAAQSARVLLLSEGCEADLRPHLEIHADDVRATHGATVGELDPEQIFYLRSRGVPEREARALLTEAFARESVEALGPASLRERVEALLSSSLRALQEAR